MLLTEPLLEAVRTTLRSNLTHIASPKTSIRITNEERVPAEAGEEFINIFGATVENLYAPTFSSRKEAYSFSIGITRRLAAIPLNHTAESIYTYDEDLMGRAKSSMARRAYEIVSQIDGNWTIPSGIRALGELSDYEFCILTPIGFSSFGELEEVTAEHFTTESEEDMVVGLFLTLNFTGLETYYYKY